MTESSRAPALSRMFESVARRGLVERDLGPAILARHEPESTIAFGMSGLAGERTAERLLSDVARVVAVLPEASPGDPREILCVAADRYHFTVALLAAWQRGHRVALPPNAQHELLRTLSDGDAISLVIHDTDEMSGLDLRPLLAEEVRATPAEPIELPAMFESRHLVSVWTSGSSGEHQRHPKTAGQLFDEALTLAKHFELGPGTRIAATVPSHHIYGLLFSVLVPLLGGGAFLRDTPLHAGVIRAALEQTGAGVLVSVPAHLRALRILDPGQLPALTRVFSSGAPLPAATARMLGERFGLATTEVLGSTETGGIAWRIQGADETPSTTLAWTPLPGVQVDRLDDGRLTVDSAFLDPRAARPWITADRVEPAKLGSPLRDGFRHVGRIDGVVKVGGKRIALAELERRLLDIPGVEDAAVAAVEVDSARGQETLAAVVAPGHSVEQLRIELRRWLDPVVIPRRIRLVDALPREPNGKLTRKRLLELFDQPKSRVATLECRAVDLDAGQDAAQDIARYQVYVPRDLMALRGHFRDHPIVPGVVQLDLAREQARGRWPELGGLRRVLRLKFVRPLRPGDQVELTLHRTRADAVEFTLRSISPGTSQGGGAETISTGTLEFGPEVSDGSGVEQA
jgi:acyl-coenzyme A synthetase/AMP-(fatty) acid ligase/3-hydroxymyristoyl/3-hydroxydecanoyl-(acyl carrier protein) dehydratase